MGSDLKELLRGAVDWYEPLGSDPEAIVRRTKRRERRRRVATGTLALALFAGAAVILYGAFSGNNHPVHRPQPANVSPSGPRTSMLIPGVTITYPGEWTLLDLWPSAGNDAVCGDSGACDRIAPSVGEPILQLSNRDLGVLGDVCSKVRPSLPPDAAVLYVAYEPHPSGQPGATWPVELVPGEGSPCSVGGTGDNLAATWVAADGTPYLAFAYVGPQAPDSDRAALLDAFSRMRFQNVRIVDEGFDHPAYVVASGVDLGRLWNLEATIASHVPPTDTPGPEIILNLHTPNVGGSISDIRPSDLADFTSWALTQDGTMAWGAVPSAANRVEATGADGAPADGQVVTLPDSMQTGYSAFVVAIPDPASSTTITAYDATGAQLASRTFGAGAGSTRYTDQTFGWTLSYPASMHLARFGGSGASSTGVTISNVPIDLGTSLDSLRSFPSGGAVLRIWHNEGGLEGPIYDNDTALPLSLSDSQEIDPYVGGSEPKPSLLGFSEDGVSYLAAVWFGPQASPEDRAAIGGVIASMRFPATHPGTTIDDRLIVLGTADDYDVGSVTRFDRSELPINTGFFAQYRGDFSFYLVHGTGGFYAVATDFLGNGSRCDLGVELDPLRFTCRSTGAIWDRYGHVLTQPNSPSTDGETDLLILPTPISWDGNIMLDPFGNWPQAAAQAWP